MHIHLETVSYCMTEVGIMIILGDDIHNISFPLSKEQ